jgi:probable addiction module antidote protein
VKKNTASKNHDDFVVEQLKKDPRFLEAYLNEALSDENEDPRVVLDMLRKVAEAKGGVRRLAQAADLNRQNLYKTLSAEKGNPEFFTINKIVHALGYHFKLVKNKRTLALAK